MAVRWHEKRQEEDEEEQGSAEQARRRRRLWEAALPPNSSPITPATLKSSDRPRVVSLSSHSELSTASGSSSRRRGPQSYRRDEAGQE